MRASGMLSSFSSSPPLAAAFHYHRLYTLPAKSQFYENNLLQLMRLLGSMQTVT